MVVAVDRHLVQGFDSVLSAVVRNMTKSMMRFKKQERSLLIFHTLTLHEQLPNPSKLSVDPLLLPPISSSTDSELVQIR